MKQPIKTLLFDLDGTLIDSQADLVASVNYVLSKLGHPVQTRDQIVPRIGNGLRRLLTESLNLTDPEVLANAKKLFDDYYSRHCVDETALYANVENCLGDLSDSFKMGVVTNKPQAHAERILDELGVISLLDVVIGGDTMAKAKPHPEPVLEALKRLSASAGSTVIVGDGHQDVLAGQAAGIRTCVVRYGFGFRPEILDLKPDYVINNFSEVKEIVK